MDTVMLIIIGSFVVEALAVAFFVWWRLFRRPKRQQFGAWSAGGFVIGDGGGDHASGTSHHGGCGGGSDHGGSCGGGSSCGGGGCGGGGD
ncbi:putative membrane protein YgcG [Mycobacterium sp. OAS707]|uniref:hypothetical protein n=1 Tax=Mycobacterium sp. OAS707 TaxID=2663822 RepID=UPI001789BC3E|nr:hypothetical protein [Mycobacterium sp. OAS707]MBE1550121.1 putative membrane protein YgcG [Mycobacterium sp. OAS707]